MQDLSHLCIMFLPMHHDYDNKRNNDDGHLQAKEFGL